MQIFRNCPLNELNEKFFCSIDIMHFLFDKKKKLINKLSQTTQQNSIGMKMMRWNKKWIIFVWMHMNGKRNHHETDKQHASYAGYSTARTMSKDEKEKICLKKNLWVCKENRKKRWVTKKTEFCHQNFFHNNSQIYLLCCL